MAPLAKRLTWLKNTSARIAAVLASGLIAGGQLSAAEPLRVAGSPTVAELVVEVARLLRDERGLELTVTSTERSAGGIAALGAEKIDIAMSSRRITPVERADAPKLNFTEIPVGEQVVALGVSRDVWEAGVRILSREQMQRIYESKTTNWRELGGPDAKIVLFNFKSGHGVWEFFAEWLYGDLSKAPEVRFPTVSSHLEARAVLEFNPGSLTQISPLFIDGEHSFALSIVGDDGKPVTPAPEPTLTRYPLARPLILLVDDKPTGAIKAVIDFILSPRGQELMKKRGFYPLHPAPFAAEDTP